MIQGVWTGVILRWGGAGKILLVCSYLRLETSSISVEAQYSEVYKSGKHISAQPRPGQNPGQTLRSEGKGII